MTQRHGGNMTGSPFLPTLCRRRRKFANCRLHPKATGCILVPLPEDATI